MKREIFISYSRKDLDAVMAIKDTITKETSSECWMDLEGIESGAVQFTQNIIAGIEECGIFLFMLSASSQKSDFALRELNYAFRKSQVNKKKHVVIVNIDDCQMTNEFEFMYGLTDTILWSNLPQRKKLLRDVKKWVGTGFSSGVDPTKRKVETEPSGVHPESVAVEVPSPEQESETATEVVDVPKKEDKSEDKPLSLEKIKNTFISSDFWRNKKMRYTIIFIVIFIPLILIGRSCKGGASHAEIEETDSLMNDSLIIDSTSIENPPIQLEYKDTFVAEPISLQRKKYLLSLSDAVFEIYSRSYGPEYWHQKYGFKYKEQDEVLIPAIWESVDNFSEGLAVVRDSTGYGYINKAGDLVLPCIWKSAYEFHDGLANVQNKNDQYCFIDKSGRVLGYEWKSAYEFHDGLAIVQNKNDQYGFIDKSGRVVISCEWKSVEEFHDGLARVQDSNENYGFINKQGKLVITCKYKSAEDFHNGIAAVQDDGGWGFINKAGRIIVPCKYHGAAWIENHPQYGTFWGLWEEDEKAGWCWKVTQKGLSGKIDMIF